MRFGEHKLPHQDGHPTVPAPRDKGVIKPVARVVRERSGNGNLRGAVVLLVRRLEAHGVDCSDITEILGDDAL